MFGDKELQDYRPAIRSHVAGTREAMKMLERDPSRDQAMVSSVNQDAAFVAVAWRGGWVTEFEIQRNGCSDAEMAALR